MKLMKQNYKIIITNEKKIKKIIKNDKKMKKKI